MTNRIGVNFCGMTMDAPTVGLQGVWGSAKSTRASKDSPTPTWGDMLERYDSRPRLGNPSHRVYETPGGMLNSIGLQNPGARHVVDEILPTLDFSETRFIANLSGSSVEDYELITESRRFRCRRP